MEYSGTNLVAQHFESIWSLMPQSHPITGPVRFVSPARFLAHKTGWSARRNFTSVLFPWSHQATDPVRLDTSAYLWFGRIWPYQATFFTNAIWYFWHWHKLDKAVMVNFTPLHVVIRGHLASSSMWQWQFGTESSNDSGCIVVARAGGQAGLPMPMLYA